MDLVGWSQRLKIEVDPILAPEILHALAIRTNRKGQLAARDTLLRRAAALVQGSLYAKVKRLLYEISTHDALPSEVRNLVLDALACAPSVRAVTSYKQVERVLLEL